MLLTIEATLTEFPPLPEKLNPVCGSVMGAERLGRWMHGDELSLRQAWDDMRQPGFTNGWLVVPLHDARLMLAESRVVSHSQGEAAERWQERTVGVMAFVWGEGGTDA